MDKEKDRLEELFKKRFQNEELPIPEGMMERLRPTFPPPPPQANSTSDKGSASATSGVLTKIVFVSTFLISVSGITWWLLSSRKNKMTTAPASISEKSTITTTQETAYDYTTQQSSVETKERIASFPSDLSPSDAHIVEEEGRLQNRYQTDPPNDNSVNHPDQVHSHSHAPKNRQKDSGVRMPSTSSIHLDGSAISTDPSGKGNVDSRKKIPDPSMKEGLDLDLPNKWEITSKANSDEELNSPNPSSIRSGSLSEANHAPDSLYRMQAKDQSNQHSETNSRADVSSLSSSQPKDSIHKETESFALLPTQKILSEQERSSDTTGILRPSSNLTNENTSFRTDSNHLGVSSQESFEKARIAPQDVRTSNQQPSESLGQLQAVKGDTMISVPIEVGSTKGLSGNEKQRPDSTTQAAILSDTTVTTATQPDTVSKQSKKRMQWRGAWLLELSAGPSFIGKNKGAVNTGTLQYKNEQANVGTSIQLDFYGKLKRNFMLGTGLHYARIMITYEASSFSLVQDSVPYDSLFLRYIPVYDSLQQIIYYDSVLDTLQLYKARVQRLTDNNSIEIIHQRYQLPIHFSYQWRSGRLGIFTNVDVLLTYYQFKYGSFKPGTQNTSEERPVLPSNKFALGLGGSWGMRYYWSKNWYVSAQVQYQLHPSVAHPSSSFALRGGIGFEY
ncbi:MAG: hypothetical protein MUF42_05945 [Cytophagaceae bacterium]|jgi:hypothetical protein|nr:hypothetical protein [Cytophagaceae bacterium]